MFPLMPPLRAKLQRLVVPLFVLLDQSFKTDIASYFVA